LLTLLTVVLSAYIRLADVGIGCEPWSECYALLNPDAEKKGITVLTAQGKDMAYRGARLAHRYIASTLGLFIIVIFAASLQQRNNRATSLLVPTLVMGLTLFLSLLGYYTPTRSNPLITMGNLLGGLCLLGLLWWMLQRATERVSASGVHGLRMLSVAALCLVLLQIILGGWSSANYASTACQELFSCSDPWLSLDNYRNAYAPGREVDLSGNGQVIREASLGALSMTHRSVALLTAAYLAWMVRRLRKHRELKATCAAISCFSLALIALGVSMIWLELPLLLLSLHNALAAGLLLSSVNLLHRLTPQPANLPPPGLPHADHSD
jgi:cytochrome c oxidase assembly protein subunit 15